MAIGLEVMNYTFIGHRDNWGGNTSLFGISHTDRHHHVYIIGKTGVGKTTLLRNLIIQHIDNGDGIGLIDPHGDLAAELLNHIPPHRADDLVYFNPGDLNFPIGLNLLADVPPDQRHLAASGIISAFKSIWGKDSWGPRLEYILYNAVSALLDCPNTSLLGVNRLLTDDRYRKKVVRKVRDPFIRHFWMEEYEGYDLRFRREAIAPIQNKLGQFLQNPVIRNILGQTKNKVSIPFMMNNRRIFIANLSKGKLGIEKSNLLGCLLTTQFQLAAMARANQSEDKRKDYFLFLDEFQNFSTDSFASILSEARKYKLSMLVAHQYIDQLSIELQRSIFGNVGTLISFKIGHTDARVLSKEFGEAFSANQFVDLDRHEIFVRLLENGVTTEPFRAKTLPPSRINVGRFKKLIARSREKYATRRSVVEEKINRWMLNWGNRKDFDTMG